MGNPVKDRSSFSSLIVGQCCCCLGLDVGSLLIGILYLLGSLGWIVDSANSQSNLSNVNYVQSVLQLISAICIFVGYAKRTSGAIWVACYVTIFMFLWSIINTILLFVALMWGSGIGMIINGLIALYFAAVLRSFAFSLEDLGVTSPA